MADLLQFPVATAQGLLFSDTAPSPTIDLSDSETRTAALDIRRSWIVEAPAGSGKTGLLIQRYLKLLAHGGVEHPEEVLAITFTRKAAAELRARVLDQLTAASEGRELPADAAEFERIGRRLAMDVLTRDRTYGWRLLASPQQLNIRTIDALCAELARSMPLLSRGIGGRSPTEDAAPLYQLAAERTLRELGGEDRALDEALRCVLLHRDAGIGDCTRLLADMLQQREQWGELIPLGADLPTDEQLDVHVRSKLERALENVICTQLSRTADALGPQLLSELAAFAARMSPEPGYKGLPSPLSICSQIHHAPGAETHHLDHWNALVGLMLKADNGWRKALNGKNLGFELPQGAETQLKDLLERLQDEDRRRPGLHNALCAVRCLPLARYPEAQWRVVKALFRVLRRALAELQVLFAERNLCDFPEVSLTARALLRDPGGELEGGSPPGTRLTHLLVDEMQDTSVGQYELIESLTRSWDGAAQTMFLVGDPKQSIYGFRHARVERFLRILGTEQLGDLRVGALRLTANFRSQAALVHAFNEVFGLILPRPEDLAERSAESEAVPFVAAVPSRGAGQSPALHWHPTFDREPVEDEGEEGEDLPARSADADAQSIRRIIEEFLDRWPRRPLGRGEKDRPPRIAVLGRNRAHLASVIAEFHRNRGRGSLPFRAVDVEVLNERPEVLDLLALTRALLHPADRVAWLAVLHSPVCGLGLADLLALTGQGVEADAAATVAQLVTVRRQHLSEEGQALLARVWPVLAAAQENLGRTLFSTHLERTWRSLGGDASLRPEAITNAQRFLHLLHKLEDGPERLNRALLERRLGTLYAEVAAPDAAVELMTIHKAKGLEWDLVLVPSLERGSGQSAHELLKWFEIDREVGAEADLILAPIQEKGDEAHPLSRWLADLQKRRSAAECKRLFYVACTRAREELHLFGVCKLKKDGELAKPRADSLLRAAWPAAEAIFSDRLARESSGLVVFPMSAPLPAAEFEQTLALAAAAEAPIPRSATRHVPTLQRLPDDFDALSRFRPEMGPRLPYPVAASLRSATSFDRPEGSFAARAFGNVVHRFLQWISSRMESGGKAAELLAEVAGWEPRLQAALRGEGLAASEAQREARRAGRALVLCLGDPVGRWLLGPRAAARNERALLTPSLGGAGSMDALRADRTFLATPAPLAEGDADHLWIVDYKTAERGGRDPETFLEEQKRKYLPQMQGYADACAAAGEDPRNIVLALYFPLDQRLTYWPAVHP